MLKNISIHNLETNSHIVLILRKINMRQVDFGNTFI